MKAISEIVEGLLKRGKVHEENLHPVTVRVSNDTAQRLDRLSKVLGENKATLMRMFLESATVEAENHLNQLQGSSEKSQGTSEKRKPKKRGSASGKTRVQKSTASPHRGQEAENREASEIGQGEQF